MSVGDNKSIFVVRLKQYSLALQQFLHRLIMFHKVTFLSDSKPAIQDLVEI